MIYTGIYDAKLIYEEDQEATLSAGRLPRNVAAQAEAIQAGFPDALTAARGHHSSGANAENSAVPLNECAERAMHTDVNAVSIPGYPHPVHTGKQRGTVIVIPGGGYRWLSHREWEPIAHAFNTYGFRALVFNYDCESEVLGLRPLKQVAWAIGKTRALFPDEPVYLCGFSAGAHVSASIGIHFDDTDWNGDPIFTEVLEELHQPSADPAQLFRPDGLMLCYPVISSGEYCHPGSFERLLGKREDFIAKYGEATDYERARRWFSLETQVHASTPRTFVWQTVEDDAVPVQNSLLLVNALIEHGIPVECHLYPKGVHGLSLATEEVTEPAKKREVDLHIADWFERAIDWLLYSEA